MRGEFGFVFRDRSAASSRLSGGAIISCTAIVAALNFGKRGFQKSKSTPWNTRVLTRSLASRTITYQIETLECALEDAKALFPAHWAEIASHKETRRFNPDFEIRFAAERAGRLLIATAREYGRLIGYIDWMIYGDLNAKDDLTCETDIYFVEDRPNRALILLAMARFSLKRLAERGVLIARPRTKAKTEGLGRGAGPLWEALGFKPLEIVYSKNLGRAI